jgi:hypothetical protein
MAVPEGDKEPTIDSKAARGPVATRAEKVYVLLHCRTEGLPKEVKQDVENASHDSH